MSSAPASPLCVLLPVALGSPFTSSRACATLAGGKLGTPHFNGHISVQMPYRHPPPTPLGIEEKVSQGPLSQERPQGAHGQRACWAPTASPLLPQDSTQSRHTMCPRKRVPFCWLSSQPLGTSASTSSTHTSGFSTRLPPDVGPPSAQPSSGGSARCWLPLPHLPWCWPRASPEPPGVQGKPPNSDLSPAQLTAWIRPPGQGGQGGPGADGRLPSSPCGSPFSLLHWAARDPGE